MDTVPDGDIRRRLIGVLDQVEGAEGVAVRIRDGVVTLRGAVPDAATRAEAAELAQRIEGVVTVRDEITVTSDLGRQIAPAWDRVQDRVLTALNSLPLILVALVVFGIVAALGWALTRPSRFWMRLAPNGFLADIYRTAARAAFALLGLVLALDVVNATALLGAVLGAAGVLGLALGFAVRDTVENFIASVMLSLRQPFRPNDLVEIEGDIGHVARLTSRATILISPDGNHVRLPNATVFKGRIVNFTRNPERRFEFDLGVDAESDLGAALATAVAAIERAEFVLDDPPVSAWIRDVGESNVLLTFTGWIDQTRTDFLKGRGEAIRVAKAALEKAGFGLPEPIYRLRLDGALPTTSAGTEATEARSEARAATRATVTETDPPAAARPTNRDRAAEEAARRERAAGDAGTDLLSQSGEAE